MLEDAEHCANSAIQVDPKNYYPFNLLGAIYFERGNAVQGEVYFLKALELGAPQRSQEEQMKGALKNAGQAERQAVAQYLLKRDPVKYKWAHHYL
jgi:cytochrome c-type biogenesis protein CcmH/NrfG